MQKYIGQVVFVFFVLIYLFELFRPISKKDREEFEKSEENLSRFSVMSLVIRAVQHAMIIGGAIAFTIGVLFARLFLK